MLPGFLIGRARGCGSVESPYQLNRFASQVESCCQDVFLLTGPGLEGAPLQKISLKMVFSVKILSEGNDVPGSIFAPEEQHVYSFSPVNVGSLR